jgi:hypothetical protein
MSVVLESSATESIDLGTFLDYLEDDLDVRDTESLAAAAPAFKSLLNNRRLLRDFLESELQNWRSGRADHEYFAHTIVLARREHFFLRANLWIAPDPARPLPTRDDPSFGYLYPHDHNFAFLTGGYLGPGYSTVLFDYDEAQVTGIAGEHVAIRPRGRATLVEGAMMLYEPSYDIHYQEHPASLSISLNVVVPANYTDRAQYLFDVERQRIDVALTPASARGTTLCALAAEIGDGETMELLAGLMHADADPRVRVAAATALGGDALAALVRSPDTRVRALAERHLASRA